MTNWIMSQNPWMMTAYAVVITAVPNSIDTVQNVIQSSPEVGAATSIIGMIQMVVTILVGLSILTLNLVKIYPRVINIMRNRKSWKSGDDDRRYDNADS